VTPGVQLKVEHGVAEFTLLAPAEAQDVRVRISAGNEEAAGTISFVPELRPMVAAGLVEGIVSFRNKAAHHPRRRSDGFEQEIGLEPPVQRRQGQPGGTHGLLPEGHGARRPAADGRLRQRQGHPRPPAARRAARRAVPGVRRRVAAQL
jgi:hypothetical protein